MTKKSLLVGIFACTALALAATACDPSGPAHTAIPIVETTAVPTVIPQTGIEYQGLLSFPLQVANDATTTDWDIRVQALSVVKTTLHAVGCALTVVADLKNRQFTLAITNLSYNGDCRAFFQEVIAGIAGLQGALLAW